MSTTPRNADYVITKAYLSFKGKAIPPASSTTKYAQLLGTLDTVQQEWSTEPDVEWDSLYADVNIGVITATDTYDLDDTIDYISKRDGDYITLDKTVNGEVNKVNVLLVSPAQLHGYREQLACAQVGRTLKFSKPFKSTDAYLGYSIVIPSRLVVEDITKGTDIVQCDNPLFLADMLAAEVARNDVTKSGQYDNLLAKAGEKMTKMKQHNGGQSEQIPRYSLSGVGDTY